MYIKWLLLTDFLHVRTCVFYVRLVFMFTKFFDEIITKFSVNKIFSLFTLNIKL